MNLFKKNFLKHLSVAMLLLLGVALFIPAYSTANARSAYSTTNARSVPASEQKLVFDHYNHNKFPSNFRKTNSTFANPNNLNITGLSTLNISGSEQYSAINLLLMKKELPTDMKLLFVDLREESHGFINGLPISWEGNGDEANMGLSRSEVIALNNSQLANIKIGVPLTIGTINITPKIVINEETLIKDNKNDYLRVTVTDTKLPTDDMVNFFVNSVKDLSKDTWLHFHCKEGEGRTTTFMVMYDMMKNCKVAPMDDIINRQIDLANLQNKNLKNPERMAFWKSFYEYCQKGDFNQAYKSVNS
ncbi:MAG: fused DSP-PTPase phosphatase/NAD kinase-like protein [Sarcina sp.]